MAKRNYGLDATIEQLSESLQEKEQGRGATALPTVTPPALPISEHEPRGFFARLRSVLFGEENIEEETNRALQGIRGEGLKREGKVLVSAHTIIYEHKIKHELYRQKLFVEGQANLQVLYDAAYLFAEADKLPLGFRGQAKADIRKLYGLKGDDVVRLLSAIHNGTTHVDEQ